MAASDNPTTSLLNPGDDSSYSLPNSDFVRTLRDKLVALKAAVKLYELVLGPPRTGKSTLIKSLSDAVDIETSAGLEACTQSSMFYVDQYHVRWWDTPGFERWNVTDAQDFLKDKFYNRQILPKAAIICRTANTYGNHNVIKYLVGEFKKHGILTVFCITKWPFIPLQERTTIVDEAVLLLHGSVNQLIYNRSAIECTPNMAYIVPINSRVDAIMLGPTCIDVPISGVNTLRKILLFKLDAVSQSRLMDLYKENQGFWTKLGYGMLDGFGLLGFEEQVALVLTEEEREVYKALRGGTLRNNQSELAQLVLRKVLSMTK